MARLTKARPIVLWTVALLYIVLTALWAFRLVPIRILGGYGLVIYGLSMLSSRMFGSLPRWSYLMWGLGSCLMGVGFAMNMAMIPTMIGSVMAMVGLFSLWAYSRRTTSGVRSSG